MNHAKVAFIVLLLAPLPICIGWTLAGIIIDMAAYMYRNPPKARDWTAMAIVLSTLVWIDFGRAWLYSPPRKEPAETTKEPNLTTSKGSGGEPVDSLRQPIKDGSR